MNPSIDENVAGQELFEPRYLVALDEIYHSHWAARKWRRIQFLKDAVAHFWPNGHPTSLIHITGTNGKGSVAHYIEQGLRFSGHTGSWTGPHVFDYAERFHIDGKIPSHDEILSIYHQFLKPYQERFIRETPGESLSFAELGILLSLHLFEKHNVKWGVMEVGAGGRYTPLMALDMKACVLTNVGNDHPVTLGTEMWQRALEKAGIAREGIPFFTSAEEPALTYVRKTAEDEKAMVYTVQQEEIDHIAAVAGDLPAFKLRNLALSVKVIQHFYPEFTFQRYMEDMTAPLPARFKEIAPNIIVDIAHNADKVNKLAEQLKYKYPNRKFRFIIGLTRNRDAREVFAPLIQLAEHITVTSASYAGQKPQELAQLLKTDFDHVEVIEEPQRALEYERTQLGDSQILVLTGSAYMIDQAVNHNPYIKHLNATFGRRVTSV